MKSETEHQFRIARSRPGSGLGLFARGLIQEGEYIIEYIGTRISTQLANKLPTRYLFEIDEDWTVDGSTRTNFARYINHACKPNCETDMQNGHIFIFAKRDINAGEELTFDYGEEYFDEFIKPVGCQCESCRSV